MASSTSDPEIVQVSQKGQATIPKPLQKKFGIETPGEVFIYEEGDHHLTPPQNGLSPPPLSDAPT